MATIPPDRLQQVLAALGEQLDARGSREHLVVVGGGGLVATGVVHRATRDVDVVALRHGDRLESAAPLPTVLVEAATAVARDFGLLPDRLNAGPTGLLDIGGLPDGFVGRVTEVRYGPALSVSYAGRLDQIHLKLYALADRSEDRDEADLRALDPSADELHAAAAWARTHNAPGPFDDRLTHVLSRFGVEDAGRLD